MSAATQTLERIELATGDEIVLIATAHTTLEYRIVRVAQATPADLVVRAAIEHRDREIDRLNATVAELMPKVVAFNQLVEVARAQRGDGSETPVDLTPSSAGEAMLAQEIDRLHRQLCLCGAGEDSDVALHDLRHREGCPLEGLWSYG